MILIVLCIAISMLGVEGAQTGTTITTSPPHGTTTLNLDQFFRAMFRAEDFNHDGIQSFAEFDQLWHLADKNGDHIVTLEEYIQSAHFSIFIGRELYKYLDHDHNNIITLQEIPRLFMEFDSNSDGVVDEQEFVDENFRMYNYIAKDIGPDIE